MLPRGKNPACGKSVTQTKGTVRAKRYALKCAQCSDSSRKLRTPAGEMPKIESENGSEHQQRTWTNESFKIISGVVDLKFLNL